MASIVKEVSLPVEAPAAWAVIRDVGNAHKAFPAVLQDCRMEGDCRVVTFANGSEVHERIVTIDDNLRRFAYTILRNDIAHHSASMTIVPDGEGCRFVWTTDLLPDSLTERFDAAMTVGIVALRRRFEAG